MSVIKEIKCSEIFDSSALPAILTKVVLDDGSVGQACVSTNTSDSKYSAENHMDHDQNRFSGRGLLRVIDKIELLLVPKLIGFDAKKQREIDNIIIESDGTSNKSRYGANATLSLSMAIAKASATSLKMPLFLYLRQFTRFANMNQKLPLFIFTLINGGKKAEGLLDFSDFFVVPGSFKSLKESFEIGYTLQLKLYSVLRRKNLLPLYSSEGGYVLALADNTSVFSIFKDAFSTSNIKLGYDYFLGIDAGADNFFIKDRYRIKDTPIPLDSSNLSAFYAELIKNHHVLYIEDPFSQDDWEGWEKISTMISGDTLIVGDLLTASNPARIQKAADKKAISGIVIRPIQVGTITESLLAVDIASLSGLRIIISRQRGGSMDDFLADFAVAVNADYVNFGPLARGENVISYNRLLEIEGQLEHN